MSTEFNYRRAWRELAGPYYEALPEAFKELHRIVSTKYSDLRQNADLGVDIVPEARELTATLQPIDLAIASRTIYFWGHWAHTPYVLVHVEGMPTKQIDVDLFPRSAADDYLKTLAAYGPVPPSRVEHVRWGPEDQTGAHWKVSKMLDQLLIERIGADRLQELRSKRCYLEAGPLEGALRLQISTPGGGWSNFDGCWAMPENVTEMFERGHPTSEEELASWFEHEPAHEWFTKDFMDHKEGTPFSQDELPGRYQHLVASLFKIDSVRSCNHKPHPYTGGPKHIEAAQDYGGMLGEAVMRRVPCAFREKGSYNTCQLPYDRHTHDEVMFLKPLRNLGNAEAAGALFKLKEAIADDKVRVDGFGFLETQEGYRIAPPDTVDAKIPENV